MMTVDVERALTGEPKTLTVLLDEIRLAAGAHPDLDRTIATLAGADPDRGPRLGGRALTTRLALAVQAALICRQADPAVADAFCSSRLGHDLLPGFGTADLTSNQIEAVLHSFRSR
jgi:putative acyl-CoA dehydrogenase